MFVVKPIGTRCFRNSSLRLAGVSLAVLAGTSMARAGISYALTDLGTLPGGNSSSATAINASGQVVGTVQIGASFQTGMNLHAVLFENGTAADLGTTNGAYPTGFVGAAATGINADGQIAANLFSGGGLSSAYMINGGNTQSLGNLGPQLAGSYSDAINDAGQVVGSSNGEAFLYGPAGLQNIGTLGGLISVATSISNNENVAGYSAFSAQSTMPTHAFLYSGGIMHDLGTIGGTVSSSATGVNDRGDVVGSSTVPGNNSRTDAFLYSNGVMQDLGTLGGVDSAALGINDAGQVVGESDLASGGQGGFLYENGTMYDLNSLATGDAGYLITSAVAINANGQIAADAITPSGQEHAVLLTPFSTPTAVALPPAAWAALSTFPLLLLGKRIRRMIR